MSCTYVNLHGVKGIFVPGTYEVMLDKVAVNMGRVWLWAGPGDSRRLYWTPHGTRILVGTN